MNIADVIKKGTCTGCGACLQKCPAKAISFWVDEYGFFYPIVDKNCKDCGICNEVCPSINKVKCVFPRVTYVAVSKNIRERKRSSSGGIFAALAHYILDQGGIVYGVTIDKKNTAKHIRIDSVYDISLVQGSKYIQSNTENTYFEVEQDLMKGYIVLYSGTPCQIAGLNSYLGGKEYKKLYTVDLVCHGVSNGKTLRQDLEKQLGEVSQDYKVDSFRTKSWNHITTYCLSLRKGNKLYKINSEVDLWYTAYINEISFRESCYSCCYAQEKRIADITLGDCSTSPLYYTFHPGEVLSTVLLNSEKAEELWKNSRRYLDYMELDFERERRYNRPLYECSKKYIERNIFFKEWYRENWDFLCKKYVVKNKTQIRIQDFLPKWFKAIIKGIIFKNDAT